ncbi:CAAX prenyl protease 2 isoform X1 [Lampetra fluviatilis]
MALRFEQLSCAQSVPACLLLACLYVGSLYVWRHEMPRDHPDVIKRRFTSVLVVSALAPFYLWLWSADQENQSWGSLLETMGIHTRGLLPAIVLPLLLTAVLFLGPIVQLTLDCPWDFVSGVKVLIAAVLGAVRLRHLVGAQPRGGAAHGGAGVPSVHAAPAGALHRPHHGRVRLSPLLRRRSLSPRHRAAQVQAGQRGDDPSVRSVPVLLYVGVWCLHGLSLHEDRWVSRRWQPRLSTRGAPPSQAATCRVSCSSCCCCTRSRSPRSTPTTRSGCSARVRPSGGRDARGAFCDSPSSAVRGVRRHLIRVGGCLVFCAAYTVSFVLVRLYCRVCVLVCLLLGSFGKVT